MAMPPLYFGVLTNREFIRLRGERRPFWEFLERCPDGWLTSLSYVNSKTPIPIPADRGPLIHDCGAWSYREETEPKITPESALARYLPLTRPGDFIVAPDHMLVDGVDHDARRAWNERSARAFIRLDVQGRIPMGVIHGQDIEERVEHVRFLQSLGYEALAIGGIAARAAQKKLAIEIVRVIREETRGRWLHVLGLSSPLYAKAWRQLGVESFDGSSHFKQAFTGGAFFTQDGARLIKWAAARPGKEATAPICDCRTCSILRGDGVDTRTYGSNETNMGRAAHNLNMLMRAQRVAMERRVVLVACCSQKSTRSAPAADLYQSPLFKKSRAWAERNGDEWLILSARHGVVRPDTVLAPYDLTLNDMSAVQRESWSRKVASQLEPFRSDRLFVLAGKNYAGFAKHLDVDIETPMSGLGIGERLAWLDAQSGPVAGSQLTLLDKEDPR